ncbi:hypothetical protein TcasGA2_TC033824 [Tribolium castaneum]|uniref:Uncharacterized protein n=1 Tax=Tribolium castaneum TaxID=7070 RepID=A0A139WER3_TRICA|nr:hypothetical protein TcasGA2_TC033824 [Tribolium castaneum]
MNTSDTFLGSHSSTNQLKGLNTAKEKILMGLLIANMLLLIFLIFVMNLLSHNC